MCPTLCNPIDGGPPGSPVPGILQARTLESVAISFSSVWKWKVKVKSLSPVRLLVTPWPAAYQAPLSMGFARQEYSLSNGEKKKINLFKLKSFFFFFSPKEVINKTKRKCKEWEKIFKNEMTDERLISKLYRQFMQLNFKKAKTQSKNGQKI